MKLIKPYYKIIKQEPGLSGIYKAIEQAGRTCYKSEDKITAESAKDFVNRMIKSGHNAMLEFGTVYLKMPVSGLMVQIEDHNYKDYMRNKYSKVKTHTAHNDYIIEAYITTNLRVLVENNWLDDLQYLCGPTEHHEKRICVKFITDRGISHELVRHRVFSFAQESTRYCNYSKDKFGGELTYICPSWLGYEEMSKLTEEANKDNKILYTRGHDGSIPQEERAKNSFIFDLSNYEHGYLFQISCGWKPQEARSVLPNSIKTEINMCGFVSDWEHFFDLRDNIHAHPDMQVLAKDLHDQFVTTKYI